MLGDPCLAARPQGQGIDRYYDVFRVYTHVCVCMCA